MLLLCGAIAAFALVGLALPARGLAASGPNFSGTYADSSYQTGIVITSGTSTSITGTAFLYGANLGPTNGQYATITGSVVNGSGTMTYADSGPQPNPASGGATSAGVNNVADVTTGGGAVSSFYLMKELDGYGPTPTTLAACNADPYCGEAQYTNTGASADSDLSASVALTQSNGQPFVVAVRAVSARR